MSAPTRTCGQCGTMSNHEGWCLVCGGSYAGSHDFHAKTFALPVADRISATRERIMGIQDTPAALEAIRRQERAAGMREAAEVVMAIGAWGDMANAVPDEFEEGTSAAYDAILALLRPEDQP